MTRRLVLSYVAVTLLTLLALVIPLGRVFASREQDRLLRDIERDATVVGSASEDALEQGRPPELGSLLTDYRADPGGRIVIVDKAGVVVADSDVGADPGGAVGSSFTNRPEVVEALQGRRAEGSRFSDTAGTDLYYVATPVTSSGVVHGAVRITYPGSALDRRVRDTWLRLGVLCLVVLGVVVLVGVLLARSVTRPVHRLIATSRELADGDLSARAPDDGGGVPELRELARSFNDMAGRLEELVGAQQSFVADAAHQLRTPLASLRLQLENLEAQSPDELQPKVAALQAETSRLARLADGLLALARAAAPAATTTVIDLAGVVVGRAATWGPAAHDVGVDLVVDLPADSQADLQGDRSSDPRTQLPGDGRASDGVPGRAVAVTAIPGALEQILDNLLANALQVAPAGSELALRVEVEGPVTRLHVVDHGPGLDEASRARAFDRFWRAADAPSGGTGLGLAIVAQLAEQCGGGAELQPAPGGGLDVVVTLRSASGPSSATTPGHAGR